MGEFKIDWNSQNFSYGALMESSEAIDKRIEWDIHRGSRKRDQYINSFGDISRMSAYMICYV